MCSKQQLKDFLCEICDGATFPVFNYVSAENYTILIKCRQKSDRKPQFYSEYATEWIRKFSKFTKSGWIVRRCFPNLKRILYRKVFTCQHSSFNKKKVPQHGVRNKQCEAKIDFRTKFINRNTIKNDNSLKDGLNLNIRIDFTHTHRIRARESFNLLKCSPDTDKMFLKYFSSGHTTISAKSYHELTLLLKYGNACDEIFANSNINPPARHLFYLHAKKKREYTHNLVNTMAEKLKVLEDSGGAMRYTDDYSVTVVITPFMKNVLTGHALDYIIIDSTPIKDGVASFFFVPSPLGALPIACALHSQNTEPSFSQAFFSTKLLLESQTFNTFAPQKIMINTIDEQNHALDAIFSNKRLFMSRASTVEEIWRLICNIKSNIAGNLRHSLMVLFNSLLRSDNLEEAEKYYRELEGDKRVKSVPKLKQYLNEIWNKREDYITQNQNKVIEMSVRILKQFLLSKCNLFNIPIMIDVLVNILDNHWCQILHAHLKKRLLIQSYTRFFLQDNTLINSLIDINISENEYRLKRISEGGKRTRITFRSDTMCCDCAVGRRGRLCTHLCAVLHSTDLTTDLPADKISFYTALAGEDTQQDALKLEPDFERADQQYTNHIEDTNDIEQLMSNLQPDVFYYVIKQEDEEKQSDPLERIENNDNSVNNSMEINVSDNKNRYENALRALNDEFRRLNKFFKDNPSSSNLDTMGLLARELSKIRPVQNVNLSNLRVEVNDTGIVCNEE